VCDKIVGKAGEGPSEYPTGSKSRQSIATPVRAWKRQTNDGRPEGPALAGLIRTGVGIPALTHGLLPDAALLLVKFVAHPFREASQNRRGLDAWKFPSVVDLAAGRESRMCRAFRAPAISGLGGASQQTEHTLRADAHAFEYRRTRSGRSS
jgi:hypothetical protein